MWDFLQNLFTALLPIVTAFAGWAGARIRNTNQKDKAVERGVKMLLRAKIIDLACITLRSEKFRRMVWKR